MKTGLFVAGALALLGCGSHDRPDPVRAAPALAVAVTAAHVEPLVELYRASGTVRGRTTVTITGKTSGYVRAVHVAAGDHVTAGQPLIDLEANDLRAGLSRARAELEHAGESRLEAESAVEGARVASKLAETTRGRIRKLFEGGAVTRQELDEAETRAQSTAAQLAMAEARLRASTSGISVARAGMAESQATLDYARVVAPFAGRVVERRVDPGAMASPGMPLLVLDDEANLRVEAWAEESRGAGLHLGDHVSVEVGDSNLGGTIAELAPGVDTASRGFLVKVDLEGHPDLRPGTFARIGFDIGTRPRLVVPTTAITAAGALDRVFVVEDHVARLRMITRGEHQGALTEVLSGLSPGEQVVSAPPAELRDGRAIEVRR